MNLEENMTDSRNSLPYFQSTEKMSSSFTDRLICLKTTYWNRGYAIVLLAFISIFVMSLQLRLCYHKVLQFMMEQNQTNNWLSYILWGFYFGIIPGGILATVYPAHNILGIFFIMSSIGHLIVAIAISYLNTSHSFLLFYIGVTQAGAYATVDRIWTYWVPLNKQSIRHVPIVLLFMIEDGIYPQILINDINKLEYANLSYTLTLLIIGVIILAWYVLWLYEINENYSLRSLNGYFILFGGSNHPLDSSGASGVTFIRSIVSDIPWKSICTSMPVLVIVLLYACDAPLRVTNHTDFNTAKEGRTMQIYTIILLLLFVLLVELVPEITVSMSTSNVRKFWSCSYFGSLGIFFALEAILGNTLRTNKIYFYMIQEIKYLYFFGFYVNTLDIAPKYCSLIRGFLLNISLGSRFLWNGFIIKIFNTMILPVAYTGTLKAIICFAMAVLYVIFATAEIQPWAANEPVIKKKQQNMVENKN